MGQRNPELISNIKTLIDEGKTNPEIARELGVSKNSVTVLAQRWLGGNPNYRKRIIKYDKDFTLEFIKYYQNHTHKECAERFGLTLSEVKSVLSGCYRKSQPYKDIRRSYTKDKRRKDPWTPGQLKKMLSYIGLLPRDEIAKRIGRKALKSANNERVIKDKLRNLRIEQPKYINGLTISRYQSLFGQRPKVYIRTTAGPGRGGAPTHFRIVPWVYIEEMIEWGKLKPQEPIRVWVKAMADFQRWIHGRDVYGSLQKIIPIERWEIDP